jgi:hypothetical protein
MLAVFTVCSLNVSQQSLAFNPPRSAYMRATGELLPKSFVPDSLEEDRISKSA